MKIAVTTEENQVFAHFGHCKNFTLFEVEDGKVTSKTALDATGSGHSALAVLLAENDVNVLICGGIGGGARQALAGAGIELVPGVAGDIDSAVSLYLAGAMIGDPNFTCSHHEGHSGGHTCGEHTCH